MEKNLIHNKGRVRTEMLVIVVLGLIGLVGGIFGWLAYFRQMGELIGFWEALYKTLQLYFLNTDFPKHEVPIILNIARFAAPMSLATAIIGKIVQLTSKQTKVLRIKYFKNHCIICGLGLVGRQIAEDCLLNRRQVVIIEINPMNPYLYSMLGTDAVILFGNATDPILLKQANINRADVLFALTNSDTTNMNIAYVASDIVNNENKAVHHHLKCIIHIAMASAYHLFFNSKFYQTPNNVFSPKLFNISQVASALVLDACPPEKQAPENQVSKKGDPPVNIMIFGLGNIGENLLLGFARTGHYLCNIPPESDKVSVSIKNKVHIVDPIADKRMEEIRALYPKLDQIVECRIYSQSPSTLTEAAFSEMVQKEGIRIVFLCMEDDRERFSILQIIHGYLLRNSIMVVDLIPSTIRNSATAENIGILLGSSFISEKEYKVFEYLKEICKLEILVNDKLDELAKSIHSLYGTKEWEKTEEVFRQSSRYQAEHLKIKLRAMSLDWEKTSVKEVEEYLANNPQLVEDLAHLEHIRYVAERFLDGWSLCNDAFELNSESQREEMKNKIKAKKLNPTLRAYFEIDEKSKAYNRESIRKIPELLKKMRVSL
jgi:hypothetical protein